MATPGVDSIHDQLVKALHGHRGLRGNDDIVRTLLPVVRKIVAEELRAAAGDREMPMDRVRDWLRDRADALLTGNDYRAEWKP